MNDMSRERSPARCAAERPAADELDRMIAAVLARIDRALPEFTHRFPSPSSIAGKYPAIANDEWTNGFWTGMLWLAWEHSLAARYRAAAEAQVESFVQRLARRINVDHHDLGFLYTLSACAAHRLTGSEAGRTAGIGAARLLLQRYDPVARVIQAWGNMSDPTQRGRMIIDCNLNLPLLYWAASETGEKAYRDAANAHFDQAAEFLVRSDGSTYHTFYIDTKTGMPRRGSTHQGFSDDSCWSRGQAWGIYGFALGFRHNGKKELIEVSARLADYFLDRLPQDGICCWDLLFTDDATQRDSSAAAIAACGLLELAAALPLSHPSRECYEKRAWAIVRRLNQAYLAPLAGSNAVLAHAVYHMPNAIGVDESCIWGDYFYFEALTRLRKAWLPYW